MLLASSAIAIHLQAQSYKAKVDTTHTLQEVQVDAAQQKKIETRFKKAVSIDEFLASSDQISLIKRGAYAWEPLLNNMSTERSSITIDGMHIFGACTDKMDPVTSYLESNALSSIAVKSGQEGNMHGATIAGNIDLKRISTPFGLDQKWSGAYQSGFEFNNKQYLNLANLAYSGSRLAADASVSYRKAGNYQDGNGDAVVHSQYSKFNSSVGVAYKTSELSSLKADIIFDQANNVGYPALPMDLWLSRGLITSLSYKQLFENKAIKSWESKLYFNALEHYMDDTKRPENKVHMDMPGWSTTYGLLSRVTLLADAHHVDLQLNAYDNLSIAEMTMYPQDRSKATMFAYTWPWVTTRFASVAGNDQWALSSMSTLSIGASFAWQYNGVRYPEFNWIFHPGAAQSRNRILPSVHANYKLQWKELAWTAGLAYGQRAPSVSEAYGYYIYNSFDRYDYIGNPDLANEQSYELSSSLTYQGKRMGLSLQGNYFYIKQYIVGKILSLGSPMNYQSVGVKGYSALDYARIFNMTAKANYSILPQLHWDANLTYARAMDPQGGNLPFIRPLSYQTALHYSYQRYGIRTAVNGDLKQSNYSPAYGEDETPAYHIWNMFADYSFPIGRVKAFLQIGAENIFNKYYSTYADWGNIPRMGRNVFTSIKLNF